MLESTGGGEAVPVDSPQVVTVTAAGLLAAVVLPHPH